MFLAHNLTRQSTRTAYGCRLSNSLGSVKPAHLCLCHLHSFALRRSRGHIKLWQAEAVFSAYRSSVWLVPGFAKRHHSANMRLRRVGYHPFLVLFFTATEVMVTVQDLTRRSTRTASPPVI